MRKRKYLIGAALALASLVVTAVAIAATQRTYTQNFGTKDFNSGKVTPPVKKPNTLTGTYFKETSNDPDNEAENNVPKQDASVDDIFPGGTKIDQGVPASCKASDDEITADPENACPKKSRVGAGAAVVAANKSGTPPEIPADVVAYNCKSKCAASKQFPDLPKKNQLILYVNPGGANQTVLRGVFQGKTGHKKLHVPIPVNCSLGTPPDCVFQGNTFPDVRIKEFELGIDKVKKTVTKGSGKNKHKVTKPFIRTPSKCPASGKWTFKIVFHGRDGKDDPLTSTSPCNSK